MEPRPWAREPGEYRSSFQEFVAGALLVTETRVLARPHGQELEAFMLIAQMPEGDERLATIVEQHELAAIDAVDYHARWASILPTPRDPYLLTRLDLRLAGSPPLEARLIFDVAVHSNDLWAAVHTGMVALVTEARFPSRPEIYTAGDDSARALIISADAGPLAQALEYGGIRDPFRPRGNAQA